MTSVGINAEFFCFAFGPSDLVNTWTFMQTLKGIASGGRLRTAECGVLPRLGQHVNGMMAVTVNCFFWVVLGSVSLRQRAHNKNLS